MSELILPRRSIWLVLLALLGGCGPAFNGLYQGADAGYLVASISAQNPPRLYHSLHYRTADQKEFGYISLPWTTGGGGLGPRGARELETETRIGVVRVLRLPAGVYEIADVSATKGDEFYQVTYSADELALPFTIRPGEITYVGAYRAEELYDTSLFGATYPVGARFYLADRSSRDVPIAQSKGASGPVTIAVPAMSDLPPGLFPDREP